MNETEQERLWSAVASPDEVVTARGLDVIPWSAEEPALYRLIVTLRDEEGDQGTRCPLTSVSAALRRRPRV